MMENIYYIIALFNLCLYSLALYFHIPLFFKSLKPNFNHYFYFVLAILSHLTLLLFLTTINHRLPLANSSEILIFFSYLFSLAYIPPYLLSKKKELAFFFFIPILIPLIISFITIEPISKTPKLYSTYFSFHIITSLTAYCCLTVSSLFSLLYLWLFKKLREHDFGLSFQKLPPLSEQEKLSVIWLILGIILMIVSSFVGRLWVLQTKQQPVDDHFSLAILFLLFSFIFLIFLKLTSTINLIWFHRINISIFVSLILIQIVGIHGFK